MTATLRRTIFVIALQLSVIFFAKAQCLEPIDSVSALKQAVEFRRDNNFAAAAKSVQTASGVYKTQKYEKGVIRCGIFWAECMIRLKKDALAASKFKEMIVACEAKPTAFAPEHTLCYARLAHLAIVNSLLDNADVYCSKGMKIAALVQPQNASLYNDLMSQFYTLAGRIWTSRGNAGKAIEMYKAAAVYYLKVKSSSKNSITQAMLYNNLGAAYETNNDLTNAAENYELAYAVFNKSNPQSVNCAMALFNLSYVAEQQGNTTKALANYTEALKIRLKIQGETVETGEIYLAMAGIYMGMMDSKIAETYAQKALAIAVQQGETDPTYMASAYEMLSAAASKTQQKEAALDYALKAVAQTRLAKNDYQHGKMLAALAVIYLDQDKPKSAIATYEQAINAFRAAGSPTYVAEMQLKVADLYIDHQKLEAAKTYLQVAIPAILRINNVNLLPTAYSVQARLAAAEGRQAEAEGYYIKAIKSCLPMSYKFNALTDSVAANQVMSPITYTEVMQKLAAFYTQRNEPVAALRAYKSGLESLLHLRRSFQSDDSKLGITLLTRNLVSRAIQVAQTAMQNNKNTKYTAFIFYFIESSKSLEILEAQQNAWAKAKAGMSADMLASEAQLHSRLAQLRKTLNDEQEKGDKANVNEINRLQIQIADFTQKMEEGYATFLKQFPMFQNLQAQQNLVSLAAVQADLRPDEILLHYLMTDTATYLLCVQRNEVQFYNLGFGNADFATATTDLQVAITSSSAATFCPAAHRLFKMTLGVIAQKINNKTLIIIPDAHLYNVPFEVLLTQNETKKDFANLPYLLTRTAITYHFSASLFHKGMEYAASGKGWLGVAPSFTTVMYADNRANSIGNKTDTTKKSNTTQLGALPFAKREVTDLAESLHGEMLLEDAATETAFRAKAAQYQVAHLATHAINDEQDPNFSRIVFAKDAKNDGFLENYELYREQPIAELVVLSACGTGAGKNEVGEGAMSLARGFMYAGTPNVLSTLWAVADKQQMQLTTLFYNELQRGANKATALRQAKLNYLKTATSATVLPRYWAGMVLFGNDKPMIISPVSTHNYIYWAVSGIATMLLGALIFWLRKAKKRNK